MGSLEGASALWFAEHLLEHPGSLLVCLDTWDGGPDLENFDIDMPSVEVQTLRIIHRVLLYRYCSAY